MDLDAVVVAHGRHVVCATVGDGVVQSDKPVSPRFCLDLVRLHVRLHPRKQRIRRAHDPLQPGFQ